jgi:hypothetical protein
VPILDVYTQGHTKAEALEMIADAIEMLANRRRFKVDVYAGRGSRGSRPPPVAAAQIWTYRIPIQARRPRA